MKDAAQERVRRISQYISCDPNDCDGDVGRIRRAPVLISTDTHFVSTFGKGQLLPQVREQLELADLLPRCVWTLKLSPVGEPSRFASGCLLLAS
jgi:hypothetical protein